MMKIFIHTRVMGRQCPVIIIIIIIIIIYTGI